MGSSVPQGQTYVQVKKPSGIITAIGILEIVVGIFGFVDSYLLVASLIIFGWLIVGGIGLFTIAAGFGLLMDEDWAWGSSTVLCILNIFVGFIEILGAFNVMFIITGLVGIGQFVGVGTLVLSAVSLYLLFRTAER